MYDAKKNVFLNDLRIPVFKTQTIQFLEKLSFIIYA